MLTLPESYPFPAAFGKSCPFTMTTDRWPTPSPSPTLGPDDVHVWRATLDLPEALLKRLATTLAPDEKARAQRYHGAQHRDHFIAARGILRSILAGYLHTAPERVRFTYNQHGRPHLQGAASMVLNFNLSHAEGLALYAVTTITHVGIDLEVVLPTVATSEIAAHFFSPAEVRALAALPDAARN
jgi:4'-phosphopantetheinyl transferase